MCLCECVRMFDFYISVKASEVSSFSYAHSSAVAIIAKLRCVCVLVGYFSHQILSLSFVVVLYPNELPFFFLLLP